MKNGPFLLGFFVVGAIVAIFYWQFYRPAPIPLPVVVQPTVTTPPTAAVIQHPVNSIQEETNAATAVIERDQPLPELNQSDESVTQILAKLFSEQKLDRFFVLEHIIERFVVMIVNLPRQRLPSTHRPLKKTQGKFLAMGETEQLVIAPENYQRYTPLVKLLSTLDKDQIVAIYKHLYPLFQQAYQELGYPNAYFNDRLIEVIDHLLTTPQSSDPIYLIRPKALYLYADSNIESLSQGRKILIRSGPENAKQIKKMLRDYRQKLTVKN